ncbi:MAG: VOC family protein [Gammaproteobacteria bacterium]|nr:VOC family protein [Gammaproteobacteria bacterium]
MQVSGIDHVVIAVHDLDRARRFFRKLGMEFSRIEQQLPDGTPVERLGVVCYTNGDGSIELVVPVYPVREDFLPEIRRLARLLEERESVLVRVGFRVRGVTDAFFAEQGIGIARKYELDEMKPLLHRNIREYVAKDEDTLGIQMAFMEYD